MRQDQSALPKAPLPPLMPKGPGSDLPKTLSAFCSPTLFVFLLHWLLVFFKNRVFCSPGWPQTPSLLGMTLNELLSLLSTSCVLS